MGLLEWGRRHGASIQSCIIPGMKIPLHLVVNYAQTKPAEIDRGLIEFFGSVPEKPYENENIEPMFWEWMIFEFKQTNGPNFITEYVLKNPDSLAKAELTKLEQAAQTFYFSEFEIMETVPGSYMLLEDIFTGDKYKIYDRLESSNITGKGMLMTRIAKIEKKWYLVGANPVHFPLTYTSRMKRMLRKNDDGFRPSVKAAAVMLIKQETNPTKPPRSVGKEEIKRKRKKLEENYKKVAVKHGVTLAFDQFLLEIYNESGRKPLDFWKMLTKKGLTESFLFGQIKLLQDTWNYFPHKCLGGLSPAEMMDKAREG